MKKCNFFFLGFISLLIVSCKKDPVASRPVDFVSTTYQNLSTYDYYGTPSVLLKDTISDTMISFINKTLPEGQNLTLSHPELFSSTAIADIVITKSSTVFVTFVTTGAGYANGLAFYTYPTNTPPVNAKDIKLITYIFPNAGNHSKIHRGDKVNIGQFDAGTTIGFALMQNGWDTTNHKLDNNVVHFCSDDVLNPEVDPKLKRHAVLINFPLENKELIAFKDVDRTLPTNDNDFNDEVFYYTLE